MEVTIERQLGEREKQRATDPPRDVAMQQNRDSVKGLGSPPQTLRERETIARLTSDRERELRRLGNVPGKLSSGDRDMDGEPMRVGTSLAKQAIADRERELDIEGNGRGVKRLHGADQVSTRGAVVIRNEEDPSDEDLQELVSQYKSALAELTFNSKPIITNLTIIAGENSHTAQGIATTICDHIISVPKEQKLPSLYLLDSIVKNIGGEYVKYFAARLPEVFCKAYRQVEPATYTAMQHLFWTWKGVFPPHPLRVIEAELNLSPKQSVPANSTQATRTSDPSSMRTGHGIHVNPKYLEAQRQLLQQSATSRVDGVTPADSNGDSRIREVERPFPRESPKGWPDTQAPRQTHGQRDRYSESGYNKAPPYDYPDFQYGRRGGPRPDMGSVRNVDRNEQGPRGGWFRDGDSERDNGGPDERPQRYSCRNGHDGRQPSGPRPLGLDGHGFVRAPGPFPHSQSLELDSWGRGGEGRGHRIDCRGLGPEALGPGTDGRGLGPDGRGLGTDGRGLRLDIWSSGSEMHGRGGWQNVEEEEYVWEDIKPQVRDQEQRSGDGRRDDRFTGDADLGRPGSANSRGRMFGAEPSGGLDGWRRPGSSHPEQFSVAGDVRDVRVTLRRESEERSRLSLSQLNQGAGVKIERDIDGAGAEQLALLPGLHSSQTRLPAQQVSVPNHSMIINSNLPPRSGTPPNLSPSTGGGSMQGGQGPYGIRQTFSSNLGQPVSYNNLSPVTPASNLLFTQHESERPLGTVQPSHQQPILHQQVKEEQVNLDPPQPSVLPVPEVLAPTLSQVPMFSQGLQSTLQFAHMSQQFGQVSGGSQLPFPQQTQSVMATVQVQQAQVNQFQQPAQPAPFLPNGQSEVPPLDTAAILELLKSVQQLPTSQSQIQPPQQLQTELQSQLQSQISAPQSSSAPAQAPQALPGQPPLPSGPPPTFFPSSVYNPFMQPGSHGQYQGQVPHLMIYPSQQPSRAGPPPLPPGPPPQLTIAANSIPQPTPQPAPLAAPVSQYDTLLKSLLAQGLISAPTLTAPTSSPVPMTGLQGVFPAVNANSGFLHPGSLQGVSSVQTISFSSALVSTIAGVTSDSVIHTESVAMTSQSVKIKDDPIGTEFKPEILKERHELVIDALYSDFPRQCKTCGLRFLEQEAHSKHMDWHVSRNRRQKSQKKVSRKWFVSGKEWLSGTGALTTEVAPSFFAAEVGVVPPRADEGESVAVPADYNQSACALCGEPFEDFYSDEKDEWMYKGAVYMNVPPGGSTEGMDSAALGLIVHAKCQTESAATAELSDDSAEVQPELMAADSVRMEIDGRGGDDVAMPLLDNFDSLDSKEESDEGGSRIKRARY